MILWKMSIRLHQLFSISFFAQVKINIHNIIVSDITVKVNFGVPFGKAFNCGEFDYIDAYDKLSATGCVQRLYKAYPPTITKVQDGYYEDYQASEIDIDIDYYYINDNFISFVKMITSE